MTLKEERHSREEEAEEPLVRVEGLTVNFVTRSAVIQAIGDISFEIMPGETFGLVGETGCGKSQTALALMRLTPEAGMIEKGRILFEGRNLTQRIEKEFRLLRKGEKRFRLRRNRRELKRLNSEMSSIRGRRISMIFQEPMTSLKPRLHDREADLRSSARARPGRTD